MAAMRAHYKDPVSQHQFSSGSAPHGEEEEKKKISHFRK